MQYGENHLLMKNLSMINGDNISINFLESTDIINIEIVMPISDKEGKITNSFDFEVETIYIENLNVSTGSTEFKDSEIKVYLTDYNNNTLVELTLINKLKNKYA